MPEVLGQKESRKLNLQAFPDNSVIMNTLDRERLMEDPDVANLVNGIVERIKGDVVQTAMSVRRPKHFRFDRQLFKTLNTERRSVAGVVSRYMDDLNDSERRLVARNLTSRRVIDRRFRSSVKRLDLNLRSEKLVSQQVAIIEQFPQLVRFTTLEDTFNRIISLQTPVLVERERSENNNGGTIVANRGLEFRLHSVKCNDDTRELGRDEINALGVATDDQGNVTKINEFEVRDDFKTGVVKTYSTPKVLKSFNLDGDDYPKEFMVMMDLIEKDSNGTSDFINDLYEAVRDEVDVIIAAIGAAAGAAIGTAIGGAAGTVAGPIGTVIGTIIGLVLGALIGWIVDAFRDDIFEPIPATLLLPSADATFEGGSLTSPTYSMVFEGFGGEYTLKYSWKITR